MVPHTHFENDEIQFAALSYCWRQDETNKLTEQSGDKVKIRVSQLAPTIRDAISVTERLGLRYLWVDALCIMQNSKKDMDVELRKMSDIYSNADFVICAVAAADSSESFIVDRNPLAVSPCLIGVQDNANTPWNKLSCFGGIFALPSQKYASRAWDDIRYSRLASRGWVFQEEYLARRMLVFTEHQIILLCNVSNTKAKQLNWESMVPWSQDIHYDLITPDLAFACYTFLWILWRNCADTGAQLGF